MKNKMIKLQKKIIEGIRNNPNPSAHRDVGYYIGITLTFISTLIMTKANIGDTHSQVVANLIACILVFLALELYQKKALGGKNTTKEMMFDIKDYMVTAGVFCFLMPLIFNHW
jgi:hypothetical protein